ncbi:MAG: hypothetical protein C5B54_05430 [Acidobacteria bacterium]|nr:MAG: hypothetical protein C5B54_05430 [Acidobacteriota bacterium]
MICVFAAILVSCGGSKLTPKDVNKVIAQDLGLTEKQVDTHAISQLAGAAQVEASLKLTFALQKRGNEWHIYKIQYSHNEWQTPDQFQNSLRNAFVAELNR